MGAYGPEVITRLHWMTDVMGPILQAAVRSRTEPLDVTGVLAQMLQMGDEAHNRNRAGSLMTLRELSPAIVAVDAPKADVAEVLRFIGGNEHFFLNLGMPSAKLAMDAVGSIPGSTMVTTLARNGTEFGIRTAGTGDRWFTAPANTPVGLFLGDYGPEDANPDIGDSAIMETYGIGGFCMAAAPAIVRFVGGTVPDALATTERMYQITLQENPAMQVPILGFRGAPTGIDVLSVARTGWLPQINTGMAGGWPAPARSAPAWCSRRRRASSRPWPRSPRSPAPPSPEPAPATGEALHPSDATSWVQGLPVRVRQRIRVPRSTGSWMPVTCRASSEARKATALAMSSGCETWSGSACMKIGASVCAWAAIRAAGRRPSCPWPRRAGAPC